MGIHYLATRGHGNDVLFSANNGENARIKGIRGETGYAYQRDYKAPEGPEFLDVGAATHAYIRGNGEIRQSTSLDGDFSVGGVSDGGHYLPCAIATIDKKVLKPFDALHKKVVEVTEKIIHYPGRVAAFCFQNWNGNVELDHKTGQPYVILRLSRGQHIPAGQAGRVIGIFREMGMADPSTPNATGWRFRWTDFEKVLERLKYATEPSRTKEGQVCVQKSISGLLLEELEGIYHSLGDAVSHTLPFRKVEEAPKKATKPVVHAPPPPPEQPVPMTTDMFIEATPIGFVLGYGNAHLDEVKMLIELADDHSVETYHYRPIRKVDFVFHKNQDSPQARADLVGDILDRVSASNIPVSNRSLEEMAEIARGYRLDAGAPNEPDMEQYSLEEHWEERIMSAQEVRRAQKQAIDRAKRHGQVREVVEETLPVTSGRIASTEPNSQIYPVGGPNNMAGFNVTPEGAIEWQGIELKEIMALASTLPAEKIAAQLGVDEAEVASVLEQLKNPPAQLAEYLDRERQKQLREENKKNLQALKEEKARIDGSKAVVNAKLAALDKEDKEAALALKKEQEILATKERRNKKMSKAMRAKIKASRRHTRGEIALQGLGVGGMLIAILTVIWAMITKKPMPNLVMNPSKKKPLELPSAKDEDIVSTGEAPVKVEEKVAEKVEA